jgi:hypothetical protein
MMIFIAVAKMDYGPMKKYETAVANGEKPDKLEKLTEMAEEKHIRIILTHRGDTDTVYFNHTELETYPMTLLSRSDHPIVALRITQGEDSIMYLGGSFNEGTKGSPNTLRKQTASFSGDTIPYTKRPSPPTLRNQRPYIYRNPERKPSKNCPPTSQGSLMHMRFSQGR